MDHDGTNPYIVESLQSGLNSRPAPDSDDAHFRSGMPNDQANGMMSNDESMKPIKRACNDCRQQKLRCDVVQSPFSPCSRCRKLGKNCKVDTTYKRVGRRDKYAEMQREIDDLRWKLQRTTQGSGLPVPRPPPASMSVPASDNVAPSTTPRNLGHATIAGELLDDLYNQYFSLYHPSLPFLDPQRYPDYYFNLSPLLGWSIVMVAARRFNREPMLQQSITVDFLKLLWSTISDVPQSYHVVKALCLICFWPLPTNSNLKDPTSQLTSLMVQIALQNMLHLDFQTQVPFRGELSQAEQQDRLMTWTACNIVAETTSMVLGLPPQTVYDSVLSSDFAFLSQYQLPFDLIGQIKIAQFSNTITKTLYCINSEPNGVISEPGRSPALEHLKGLYNHLKISLSDNISIITQLHLHAASVHLNAFAFFLPPGSPGHGTSLLLLYDSICVFLQDVMNCETTTGTLLEHCSNLVSQTIFSSTFALVKLLNCSFSRNIDLERGKSLFNGIILAARRMSVQQEDLASRVATRVPLLWRSLGAGAPWVPSNPDPVVLQIHFRMSVSHIYDCYWAWREQLKNRDATKTEDLRISSSSAMGTPSATGFENHSRMSIPSGLDLGNLDLFNSMDWMFGDWSGMSLDPFIFNP